MSESGERRALSAFFKTVDGGYVYRAPSGWRLWRQSHFLVNADLRERLIASSDEPSWVPVLWIAVPWIVVSIAGVAALAFLFGGSTDDPLWPIASGLVFAVIGLVAGLAALAEHKWRRVAPLLRTALPTEERISPTELAAAIRSAGGPSRRAFFGQILGGASMLAVGVFNAGMSIEKLNHSGAFWPLLISGAVMAVIGFFLIFVGARSLAKKND